MKNNLQKLSIKGIEIYSNHGVYEFEKNGKTLFIIDVHLYGDFTKSMESDQLADTVDYQIIYDIVTEEMAIHSDLIEHITARISSKIRLQFPEIQKTKVRVSKMHPPLKGTVNKTVFEMVY